jgi:hypothetical protein
VFVCDVVHDPTGAKAKSPKGKAGRVRGVASS